MKGTYLYAIVAGEHQLDLGRSGLPDGWARVTTLPAAGLAGVVGEYRGPDFGELARPDLLRCLSIHQRVVERVMADRPVLPARFGTVLASQDELRTALGRFEQRLAATLAHLGDAVEIEVAAICDLKRTFAEIGREPAIAAAAAGVAGRSAEEILAARIQVGKLVKEALDRRRAEYRRQVAHVLLPLARDAQPNPLVSDELVVNIAFLVERARLADFDAGVHRLDEALDGRLTFRCVGPLPPYSFATVELIRPRLDEIDAARRLLELGEQVSEAEISASYRRLATRYHPDRSPGDPTAPERFATLAAAHARLLAYVRGRRTGESQEDDIRQHDLLAPSDGAGLLLAIKRSAPGSSLHEEPSHERDAAVV